MFDLKSFLIVALPSAAALLPIVLGLVTYLGNLGVKGKAQLISSLLSGLILGGFTLYFQAPPKGGADWFAIVLFGLIVGLAASGVYDTGKALVVRMNNVKEQSG